MRHLFHQISLCPGRSAAGSREARPRGWCAADPGPPQARCLMPQIRCLWRSRISGAPLRASRYVLHRIRDISGKLAALVTGLRSCLSLFKHPDLPDVPLMIELAPNATVRTIFELILITGE